MFGSGLARRVRGRARVALLVVGAVSGAGMSAASMAAAPSKWQFPEMQPKETASEIPSAPKVNGWNGPRGRDRGR